jgi:hypothetical protein
MAAGSCKGFGVSGTAKECVIGPDAPCTPVVTAGDRLRDECEAQGGTACRCACHDYVCSIRIDSFKGDAGGLAEPRGGFSHVGET